MIQFVNETATHNADDLEFAIICIGGGFIVLMMFKWWGRW